MSDGEGAFRAQTLGCGLDRPQVLTAPKDGPCWFPRSTDGSQHLHPASQGSRTTIPKISRARTSGRSSRHIGGPIVAFTPIDPEMVVVDAVLDMTWKLSGDRPGRGFELATTAPQSRLTRDRRTHVAQGDRDLGCRALTFGCSPKVASRVRAGAKCGRSLRRSWSGRDRNLAQRRDEK
jgi:hypothetical protein